MERRFEVWGGFRGGFRVWGSGFRVYRDLPLWPQVPPFQGALPACISADSDVELLTEAICVALEEPENPPAWTQAEEDPGRAPKRRPKKSREKQTGRFRQVCFRRRRPPYPQGRWTGTSWQPNGRWWHVSAVIFYPGADGAVVAVMCRSLPSEDLQPKP